MDMYVEATYMDAPLCCLHDANVNRCRWKWEEATAVTSGYNTPPDPHDRDEREDRRRRKIEGGRRRMLGSGGSSASSDAARHDDYSGCDDTAQPRPYSTILTYLIQDLTLYDVSSIFTCLLYAQPFDIIEILNF